MCASKAIPSGGILDLSTAKYSSFPPDKPMHAGPSPSAVRALNISLCGVRADNFYRPPPVRIPSLGLLVKYGADVTIHEAKTQIMIREKLCGQVPIPKVFAWVEDGGQVFIYMQLIQGETLQAQWHNLDEADRLSVCSQLKCMVASWRNLGQDGQECYIGW